MCVCVFVCVCVCVHCAVGLCVVLLDIPFDIVGVKQLFWTWHDTDPNINERHYHVPWTSYYFHASFAAGFTILFNGTRDLIGRRSSDAEQRMQADGSVSTALLLANHSLKTSYRN